MTEDGEERRDLLDDASDALLVGRAVDGDTRAFAALVRRYTPNLRAYARRLLGSTSDVDDVVQLTFLTAWQQLDRLHEPAAVKGWLFTVANRKALEVRRKHRDHADVDDHEQAGPETADPAHRSEEDARQRALGAVLSALPDDQRRCWLLREGGDLGYAEIAAELDLPVSTVRGLLVRARKRVAQEMEGWR